MDSSECDQLELGTAGRGGTIRTAVETCLREFGYRYSVNSDGNDIRFECQTERGRWRAQFLVDEDSRVLQLFVYLTGAGYLASRQGWVMELVCRLNEAIAVLGHFTLEWETGTALYRYSLDLRRRDVNASTVEDMLNSLAFPLHVWEQAYQHIRSPNIPPADALDASRIVVGVYDRESVSDDTRRALLAVAEGGAKADIAIAGSETGARHPRLTLL